MATKPTTWTDLIISIIMLLVFAAIFGLVYEQIRPLCHGPKVTYWQSVAIVWLIRFISNLISGK